jgi:hypothetical protein
MAPIEWYYAQGNKQRGPVTAAELKLLADRGELSPDDLVWRAGMEDWIAARKVKGLFDSPSRSVAAPVPAPPLEPAPASPSQAPVLPATSADAIPATAAPTSRLRTAFERSPAAFERSREGSARHLFDYLLEAARARFTPPLVDATARLFTLVGHYGLYAAMALVLVFHIALAARSNSFRSFVVGLILTAALALLQYAASRFSGTLVRLDRSTCGQMASTAFLDCVALSCSVLGLVGLVGLTLLALQFRAFSWLLPGLAAFILCHYAAIVAMNPETLRVTISAETTVSEEAIGVITALAKMGLRIGPVAYGVGVVWGATKMLWAIYLVLFPASAASATGLTGLDALLGAPGMSLGGGPAGGIGGLGDIDRLSPLDGLSSGLGGASSPLLGELTKFLPAQVAAASGIWVLFLSAALPALLYFVFLFSYVMVDLLRLFLGLARRVEDLAEVKKEEN